MDILLTCGPLRGPFSLVAGAVAGCLLRSLLGGLGACCLFMGETGWGNMTCENFWPDFFSWPSGVHEASPSPFVALLFCFFMVGPGECDMTCVELFGHRFRRIPADALGRINVHLDHEAHAAFLPCVSGFRVVACSWLPSASTA